MYFKKAIEPCGSTGRTEKFSERGNLRSNTIPTRVNSKTLIQSNELDSASGIYTDPSNIIYISLLFPHPSLYPSNEMLLEY